MLKTPDTSSTKRRNVVAVSDHWQRPAATEEAAYLSVVKQEDSLGFEYVGVPWATLIDALRGKSTKAHQILSALLHIDSSRAHSGAKRCTVVQHIHALNHLDLLKAIGISDLFWSHATKDCMERDGVRIHPFPLFPAQAPKYDADLSASKKFLANFVGAFNPKIYLSNVREVIFNDEGTAHDLNIIKRDRWHFDRAVYEEQIGGHTASALQLDAEQSMKQEYINAIRQSWFTLCPTGSGPNSIRIFESLALGSIPIVLTKDLRLSGPQDLWDRAAIFEEDSEAGYRRSLQRARSVTFQDRRMMLEAGKELFEQVQPNAFGRIIKKVAS
ncbi:MAG: exostosin domain-containing protein [Henriciella sp.]